MAKKKETSASPFVPAEEQPYKIPDNWCWVKFGQIIELISGRDVALSECNDRGCGIPYILGASNIENNAFTAERWIEVPQVVSNKNDILLSVKGTIGKLYIQQETVINLSRQIMAIRPLYDIKILFVYYFLQNSCDELRESGNGLIPGISRSDILEKAFPLAPLSEQQRIVARIESLFAKLDEAREKAQAVLDGFELRKSAILHKAFTGELTEKWREENGVGLDSWETKPLIEVASLQTGLMKGKRYEGETVFLPYLRVANVQDGFLDLKEIKEIKVSTSNIARYSLKKGDVLFTEGGDFDKLGRGTVWEEEIPNCLHQNHIFVVRPHKSVLNSYFLSYQAGSKYGKAYFLSCSKQTTNLASINSTQLKGFPV